MEIKVILAGVGECNQDFSKWDTYIATEVYRRRDRMKPRPRKV
jgi:hypothetical protein